MTLHKLFYFTNCSSCPLKTQHWETQVKSGQPFSLSQLELKFLGLKKNFRYKFMTFLKFLYFMNFSLCSFKKRSTGKFRLAVLTLPAGIEIFEPQKNFQVYIYDPSDTSLFNEHFFVSTQKMKHWEFQVNEKCLDLKKNL